MKILHLGKFYPPARGGMETILALVCERTAGRVQNRAIVANDTRATVAERHGDVGIVRVGAWKKIGAVAFCPTMPVRIAKEHADLVIIHEPNPMGLLSYFLARPEGRLIVWFHSEVVRPTWRYRVFYRPFLDFALSRASKIIVASPTLAASTPQLRAWRSKCVVIPYGLELGAESDASARQAETRPKRPIVLFVGRLVPYKGAAVLLEAMRGIEADAMLVGDGPEREALANRARELGVADRVTFLGNVANEQLRGLYDACDVFVLPSITRQEAFGLVQVEAMARGKPVISTDLGTGVSWVNQHGETGLVVAPGDVLALHSAIEELLADPGKRAAFGAAGARRARSVFHVDRMIDSTLQLYSEVMGQPPGMSHKAKRAFDVVLAGGGLLASAPVALILAVLIKVEDGGPIFFGQERVGKNGRPFLALKFRSMVPDAEARVGPMQAAAGDWRVTRIGRLMRATAMDELPQLWNIFSGDMSFVGPRALRPGEIEVNGRGAVERLEDVPGFDTRSAVVPGLTGVAQIYAPRDVTRRHKFRYDRVYIRRQSFWLDLRLIVLSFWITFRGTWEARGRKF